jgi:cytochrome c oxidase subunit IV
LSERDFHNEHAGHDHVVPVRNYILVFTTLIVLTGVTVFAASRDLGALNVPIALTIAGFKAFLVLFIFMHVKYSSRLVSTIIIATGAWLMVLLLGIFGDYVVRRDVSDSNVAPPKPQIESATHSGSHAKPAEDPHAKAAEH